MTINSTLGRDKPPKDWMKIGFYAIAVLFNLCLIAQLLTVGIAYLYSFPKRVETTWRRGEASDRPKDGTGLRARPRSIVRGFKN